MNMILNKRFWTCTMHIIYSIELYIWHMSRNFCIAMNMSDIHKWRMVRCIAYDIVVCACLEIGVNHRTSILMECFGPILWNFRYFVAINNSIANINGIFVIAIVVDDWMRWELNEINFCNEIQNNNSWMQLYTGKNMLEVLQC